MRPLTDVWAKPLLPIDGRPVFATLLRGLADGGFAEAFVVVGHLGAQIEALVGDGSAFGLRVRFAEQPDPLGSADAVLRAVETGARAPFLVTAADTVYAPGDLARAQTAFEASDAVAALAVREVACGDADERAAVRVDGDRLVAVGGRHEAEGERVLAAAPLWILGERIVRVLADVPGPPYELADAVRDALDAGENVLAVRFGPTRDLTRPGDVVAQNFPYLSTYRGMSE